MTRRCAASVVALCVVVLCAGRVSAQEIGWSPGLLYTANFLGDVETTDIIDQNGIVQTTSITTSKVRPAFEVHAVGGWDKLKIGPFVGVELGDNVVNALGGGATFIVMGMPISVGYWVQPSADIRRDDFVPGSPAPPGYDEVQYVGKSVKSLAIMVGIPLP